MTLVWWEIELKNKIFSINEEVFGNMENKQTWHDSGQEYNIIPQGIHVIEGSIIFCGQPLFHVHIVRGQSYNLP